MYNNTRKVYSEVNAFLNIMPNEYIEKIPNQIKQTIKDNKEETYTPSYTFDVPIEKQEISDDAIAMIAWIHLNYWCANDEEKNELNRIFDENERVYQENLREKYNPDNVFKNKEKQNSFSEEPLEMTTKPKEGFFKKLKEWFTKVFNNIKK